MSRWPPGASTWPVAPTTPSTAASRPTLTRESPLTTRAAAPATRGGVGAHAARHAALSRSRGRAPARARGQSSSPARTSSPSPPTRAGWPRSPAAFRESGPASPRWDRRATRPAHRGPADRRPTSRASASTPRRRRRSGIARCPRRVSRPKYTARPATSPPSWSSMAFRSSASSAVVSPSGRGSSSISVTATW